MAERFIDGLKVTVPGTTVKRWCEEASERHASRADFYTGQIESLRAGGVKAENASGDPIHALESRRDDHWGKANWFTLLAQYIDTSAAFVLTDYDLQKLEQGK